MNKIIDKLKGTTKTLYKWNYVSHEYIPVEVPSHWNCKTFSFDMEEKVNCPHCGRKTMVGDTYTSLEFHEQCFGFGYCVCSKCYEKELAKKREFSKNDM